MLVIPAIHLHGGVCTGTLPGSRTPEELLDRQPSSWARWLERAGAPAIHLVDGDGERAGRLVQFLDLLDVLMAVAVPVQVSAGLRARSEIAQVLSRGAARVTVDASRIPSPDLERLIDDFGERLVPAIACTPGADGRAPVQEHLGRLRQAGAARVLCEVPERTGTLAGAAVDLYADLAEAGLPLIASGGVGSLDHFGALARLPHLEAVIVHRAVWEGRFALPEAQIAAGAAAREGQ